MHSKGTREHKGTGMFRIFQENRQPVDQQSLRDAVQHRTKERFKPHFVRERAPKLN